MKKFLLFAFLVFLTAGCAEDTTNNTTSGNQTSPEQIAKVDDAFALEFKKYVKDSTGSAVYTGEYSALAESNIKSLLQNITGRGGMPAAAGIGEVANEEVATSIAKIIASDTISAEVLKYDTLNQSANSFLSSVLQIFMTTNGSTLITTLKRVNNNSQSIVTLSDSLQTALTTETISANARANIIYLNASLISYLKNNATSGIAGIKEEYVLPNNKAMLDEIAQAFIAQGEYSSNIINYDMPTTDFKVMPILANGGSMPGAIQTMMALMTKLTTIFEKYGYADNSSSGTQDEEAIATSGMDEMIFPSMMLSGLTGYESTTTQKSKNRALEFYRALIKAGGTKLTTFNPASDATYAKESIVPVIITELQTSGVNNYSDFNVDSTTFTTNVVNKFFNDTTPTDAGNTLITNYNNAAAQLPSAQAY